MKNRKERSKYKEINENNGINLNKDLEKIKENHTKKIKKTLYSKLSYGLCVAGMVLLVLVALLLPQVLFSVQDKYRMRNIEAEARSSLDFSQMNLTYEQGTNARMYKLLHMKNKTVTAIEHEFSNDVELRELLGTIFYQEWFGMLHDNVLMTNYFYAVVSWDAVRANVQECKKYIVYGDNYQDGVALMMWYLDLYLNDIDTRVRLLVDAETDTIYYVKITAMDLKNEKETLPNTASQVEIDKIIKSEEYETEELYYLADMFHQYSHIYYTYYEADKYEELEKSDKEDWLTETKIDVDCCEVALQLPYGELSIPFYFQVENSSGIYPNITMGISMIGELVSEMIQD